MKAVARYFHTLRFLRPRQLVARVAHRLHRPAPDLRPAPPLRRMPADYVAPIAPAPSLVAADTFRFLGIEARCAAAADWTADTRELLWTYNLHYFDDLNATGSSARREWHGELVRRWIAENPPARGAGWDSYPVARRIVNWIKWALQTGPLTEAADASLAVQARWLSARVEYHLLGNHLFVNGKALVYAGLYFDGPEAQGLLSQGLRIIERELREQVLADGGHFERSTMYHAAALEDVLDLVNLFQAAGCSVPGAWLDAARAMHAWLRVMTHRDGDIAFFNDAAFGIAPTAAELAQYAQRLGHAAPPAAPAPLVLLRDSGYARLQNERLALIADCAAIGPDYLPGHAHADTLSFELDVDGARLFVNSGTSQYGTGVERVRQRGTAAHNTVVVDGADSSEVWSGFRVARRARARIVAAQGAPVPWLEGSHDGYRRLPGRNVHTRRWTLLPGGLQIEDRVSGTFGSAEAFLHLHPDASARQRSGEVIELALAGATRAWLSFEGAAQVGVRAGTWHPRFGAALANQCIVARFDGARLVAHFELD